jgi:hypothetical protein
VQDAIKNVIVLYNLTEAFDNGLKDHVLGGLFAFVSNPFECHPRFGVEYERNFIAVFDPFEAKFVCIGISIQVSLSGIASTKANRGRVFRTLPRLRLCSVPGLLLDLSRFFVVVIGIRRFLLDAG